MKIRELLKRDMSKVIGIGTNVYIVFALLSPFILSEIVIELNSTMLLLIIWLFAYILFLPVCVVIFVIYSYVTKKEILSLIEMMLIGIVASLIVGCGIFFTLPKEEQGNVDIDIDKIQQTQDDLAETQEKTTKSNEINKIRCEVLVENNYIENVYTAEKFIKNNDINNAKQHIQWANEKLMLQYAYLKDLDNLPKEWNEIIDSDVLFIMDIDIEATKKALKDLQDHKREDQLFILNATALQLKNLDAHVNEIFLKVNCD